jgi:hypothetical protein
VLYSAKEISLSDLKKAIVEDFKREEAIGDYFQAVPEGPRRRDVYVFDSSRRTDVAQMPMLGYAVRGDVRLRNCWAFTGKRDCAESVIPQVRTVLLGGKTEADAFEEASTAGIVLTGDWALVERDGVWTSGKTSGLEIPLPLGYVGGDLRLQFDGFAYAARMGMVQHVEARVQGKPVASWVLTPDIWISEDSLGKEKITLEFLVQDPISPFELGVDALDRRPLGIFIQAITLSIAHPFEAGLIIQARNLHGRIGLASGWGRVEEKGIWSEGGEAVLRLPIASGGEPNHEVYIKGYAYCRNGHSQRVDVHANGIKIESWLLLPCDSALPRIQIPKDLRIGSCLELRFALPDAKSPSELGVDPNDYRKLGIFLQSVTLPTK